MAASASVQLVRLTCVKCNTPLPAEETDIAWVCANCEQGMLLTPTGLAPITVRWAAAKSGAANLRWLPFWSFTGAVRFNQRLNFGGRSEADALWQQPQRFFVPAYPCSLPDLQAMGAALLKRRLNPTPGPTPAGGQLAHCTLFPADAKQAAEFVVLTIEAERKDKLKKIEFTIEATEPELWLLPFAGDQLAL